VVRFSAASAFSRGAGCFDTFIEDHGNVGPQSELDIRGFFRRKEMFGAIEMGAEAHALIGYFRNLERLKTW